MMEFIKMRDKLMPEMLGRHDPVFERPPSQWEQGMMMGNGLIGTVLWGGGEDPLKLSVDHAEIWETRGWRPDKDHNWQAYKKLLEQDRGAETQGFSNPFDKGDFFPTRVPFGRMELTLKGKTRSYEMKFDLHGAVSTAEIGTDAGGVSLTTYVAATEDVFVVDLRYTGGERAQVSWKYHTVPGSYTEEDRKKATRYGLMTTTYEQLMREWDYPASVVRQGEVSTWMQTMPGSGSFASALMRLEPEQGREVYIISIICDHNTEDCASRAERAVRQAAGLGLEELLRRHRAWWADYWKRSFLTIPDARIEAYYYLETYLLACCTRPGGLHMTIQGPWTDDDDLIPICLNDYHWNNEQQMHVWPVYTSNRLDYGEPLFDLIEENLQNLKDASSFHFGVEGAFLAHCTDRYMNPSYINVDNFELNGLPWVCFHYWQHWRYTLDEDFLEKRAYPVMRLALAPLLSELQEWEDGLLHLPWTSSPEYHSPQETMRWLLHEGPEWGGRFGPDATIDLSLTRWLLVTLLEGAEILAKRGFKEDQSTLALWRETLAKLAPYPIDELGGLAVRRGLSLSTSHRHQSHLFPFYPLHEYTKENMPELYEKCLDRLGLVGRGEWVGWSFPWIALIYAYGGRPAAARNVLSDMVERYVTEAGTHYQGPINGCDVSLYGNGSGNFGLTIEAQLGFPAAVQELLIQSNGDRITLFDCAPPLWADAAISGMRAEGAFLIDALRREYTTVFARVECEKGGTLRLCTDFGGKPPVTVNGRAVDCALDGCCWVLDTKPGDIVVFGELEEIGCIPVKEEHFFGTKRIRRF